MKNNSITSVKVDKTLYDSFKINNVKKKFYLQEGSDRPLQSMAQVPYSRSVLC